jgi:hypothetical protein
MAHSITVLKIRTCTRADEILEGLAERLDVPHIWQNSNGRAQLWLQFDPERAFDAVVTALEETAEDWRPYLTVIRPHEATEDLRQTG